MSIRDNSDIVALSRWQFPRTLSAEQQSQKDALDASPLPKPEGWNAALDKALFAELDRCLEKWADETRDFCAFAKIPCIFFFFAHNAHAH